ncbi:guanylate kinase [Mycoplasma sp. SG1]|uniref:guanylate kinase n=1 Tax=Mycoplasma sp. SG1 TaxID=2810348 RepID=UPI0020246DBA|nr:guanylate kinase [Mycoplasma sp. SG1]URM53156.1 guanylate kinase [Mycoplasma sp. SG1]
MVHNQGKKDNKLIVISGPSGVGKNSIVKELLKDSELNLHYSVSCTSRSIRDGEVNNEAYHFISREEFESKIKNDEFIEYTEYLGNYYGTLKSEIFDNIDKKTVLLEIEYKGLENLKKIFQNSVYIVSIGVLPYHSEDIEHIGKLIDSRLKKRNLDHPEIIKKRLSYILKEELIKYNNKLYNYIVYNKDQNLSETIKEVKKIILKNC